MFRSIGKSPLGRRAFVKLALVGIFAVPNIAGAEILTKGSFGGRDAYLKRVQDLSNVLAGMPRSDEGRRAELRAVTTTLSAAVQDMLFNEAQARKGKVAPPASGLAAPTSARNGAGDALPIAQVPVDWLLLKGGAVQDDAADLLALLEDTGEPLTSQAISALIASMAAAAAALNRPSI